MWRGGDVINCHSCRDDVGRCCTMWLGGDVIESSLMLGDVGRCHTMWRGGDVTASSLMVGDVGPCHTMASWRCRGVVIPAVGDERCQRIVTYNGLMRGDLIITRWILDDVMGPRVDMAWYHRPNYDRVAVG